MQFKIGDKVRINKKFPNPYVFGKICVITEIEHAQSYFDYDVQEKGTCWSCPVHRNEIELVRKIGEQLLLFEL